MCCLSVHPLLASVKLSPELDIEKSAYNVDWVGIDHVESLSLAIQYLKRVDSV